MISSYTAGHADTGGQALSRGIMIAGMIWLALFSWISATNVPYPFYGHEIYDIYYATILDGQLDIPPRTIRFEGWYAPDGTAYMYHGVAPLLTRFALGWVWPFDALPMSGVSIWLWAVLGTIGYQSALTGLARRAGIWDRRQTAILVLCAGLWLAGPALLLVSSQNFYHEPIAVAFGATGLFVAIWVRMASGTMDLAKAVIWMALLATIAFHARPNVAVTLYAGTGFTICWGLWRNRVAFLLPALLSSAVLGAGVGGYLALNEARLGSAAGMDGNYERTYGFRFWGEEEPNSVRAEAFREHGRFNPLRVVPNLFLYTVDVPVSWPGLGRVSALIYTTYESVTEPILGFIRVEHPRVGFILMWPLWTYLSLLGLWVLRRDPPMAALAFCMMLSFGLTLAYGTVTLRYRIDLWPMLAVLSLIGTIRLLNPSISMRYKPIIAALLCVGAVGSYITFYQYSQFSIEAGVMGPWSYEYCSELAQTKGFQGDDLTRICREPSMGGT